MSKKKHGPGEEDVKVDLPITPMLDMAFQLMAFFIFTFKPQPTEGQISLFLPQLKGNESVQMAPPPPDTPVEAKEEYTIIVRAAEGQIASIDFRGQGAPEPLGTQPSRLLERLNQIPRRDGDNVSVKIESDPKLNYNQLIRLMDVCIKAKFPSVGVAPLSASSQ
ncbi:ExbD/TolR family protein [Tuwongella immobilis]|uniref:Biopolymer transporter ExbD n=1 Tax=Tuwongella immobilis TaxID=692036 RepID=A0A6C2YNH3_9BACT|nr:biopolymer transporter ExbD [Tuwongella immobilis]VIP03168.1 biopolymer transport protein : Biopolymer transport protein OS=Singulisphaera acidiphila (strain ATCC BAA-1392 / DSM 18658 / VKM B-2454 / MOB10) GN=Sinac_5151 PE=3 SV=1: ExbD [Tuwongella immobilis]VTS03591.1 biopolymer transport protein : Biopolymer transport protein OS=Singulisphaera acidiphila (strain ATCC BAA-1392 / DSM 18658 / VKM B-2454 / MOB10) GN=Sinac_5151 PE=3 SV=1: ExbD [Tuwongella immobilis]